MALTAIELNKLIDNKLGGAPKLAQVLKVIINRALEGKTTPDIDETTEGKVLSNDGEVPTWITLDSGDSLREISLNLDMDGVETTKFVSREDMEVPDGFRLEPLVSQIPFNFINFYTTFESAGVTFHFQTAPAAGLLYPHVIYRNIVDA